MSGRPGWTRPPAMQQTSLPPRSGCSRPTTPAGSPCAACHCGLWASFRRMNSYPSFPRSMIWSLSSTACGGSTAMPSSAGPWRCWTRLWAWTPRGTRHPPHRVPGDPRSELVEAGPSSWSPERRVPVCRCAPPLGLAKSNPNCYAALC